MSLHSKLWAPRHGLLLLPGFWAEVRPRVGVSGSVELVPGPGLEHVLCRKTLQLARQLQDQAVEAQACYSLGNTYTLMQDYERAAEYHLRHLLIAQELVDR